MCLTSSLLRQSLGEPMHRLWKSSSLHPICLLRLVGYRQLVRIDRDVGLYIAAGRKFGLEQLFGVSEESFGGIRLVEV